MGISTVVVVAAGGGPDVRLPAGATVVAADGGLRRAQALGLEVAVAVGDFDSADADTVRAAEAAGTRILRFPAAKDETDLELALGEALALQPERIVVVASAGGRLDHLLGACLALAAPRLAGVEVDGLVGDAVVNVVRSERVLRGAVGDMVSLLPVHGDAEGVRTRGLAYPLDGETLPAGSSRGVSNVFAEEEATVAIERGVLLAVRPGRDDEGGAA